METQCILKCKLKPILQNRNISVNKLSQEIGERRSTINDLINNKDMGTKRIPATLIAKLSMYLDLSLDEMFEVKKEHQ